MTSLKDAALNYEKKDITSLSEIPVDIEIKKATFEKNGQKGEYNFIEVNGWKYSVKASLLDQIKQTITYRPATTKIKVAKNEKGEFHVIPLD